MTINFVQNSHTFNQNIGHIQNIIQKIIIDCYVLLIGQFIVWVKIGAFTGKAYFSKLFYLLAFCIVLLLFAKKKEALSFFFRR